LALSRIGAMLSSMGSSTPARGLQKEVLVHPDARTRPQGALDQVEYRQSIVCAEDAENFVERAPDGLFLRPSRKPLRDNVDECDATMTIGGNDGVADARQCRRQPAFLLEKLCVYAMPIECELNRGVQLSSLNVVRTQPKGSVAVASCSEAACASAAR
jgi:hypothetical protein